MDFEHFFLGGALLGLLASCWSYVKTLTWRVVNLLIVKVRVKDSTRLAVTAYCWRKLKRSPFGEKEYSGCVGYVRPVDRYLMIGYEEPGKDPTVFWKGWRPLVVGIDYPSSGSGSGAIPEVAMSLTFIRGTFDIDELLIEALDDFNDRQHDGDMEHGKAARFVVNRVFGRMSRGLDDAVRQHGRPSNPEYATAVNDPSQDTRSRRILKWSADELGARGGGDNPFSTLALPQNAMVIVGKVQRWIESEKWYKEKMIPWRLGILLYGQPGTGKTSVARAIGQRFDLPIHIFDLSTFGNEDFTQEWNRVLASTPCMLLVEDIDAVFNGRSNRLGDGERGLTFDCFLNSLSGVKESNGVLVVITTNHPETLDEALGKPNNDRGGISTRPGRIDHVLELGPLDEECRRRVADRILSDCRHHINRLVEEGAGDTGAQFQNRCEQIALEEYWQISHAQPERMSKEEHILEIEKQLHRLEEV